MRKTIRATLVIVLLGALGAAAAPAAKGAKKLPPGGGEPGAAYLAYFAALNKGDVAGLKKLKLPELEGFDDSVIKVWAERMKSDVPQNVKFLDGTVDGDVATLHVTAVEIGEPEWGTVTMKKVEGVWRKENASWTMVPPKKK